MSHDHAARVAREAARRFRGNACPILEHGLAGLIGIDQGGRVDVDDYLVSLSRGARIDSVMERGFCEKSQRIGLLLSHGRRLTGRVGNAARD